MAATIGNLITASTYNAIRSKINKVLGTGDNAEFGYGQTLETPLKADNDIIEAADMDAMYNDLVLAATHQSGNPPVWTVPTEGLNAPDAGEIVGVYAADLGAADPNTGNRTTINSVNDTNEGFLDFEQAAAQIETNHFQTGSGALTTAVATESIRTSAWKTSINHQVTVQWTSADHRRYWANAGGKIRFNANLTGGTSQPGDETQTPPGTKDEIWQTMLNSMGTIEIGVQGTTATGTGTVSSNLSIIYVDRGIPLSWVNTSSSLPRTVFIKTGSGVYSENRYIIEAWQVSDSAIRFNIQLFDYDVGDLQDQDEGVAIDENVTGTITSTVSFVTPDGFLDIAAPAITTNSVL